MARRHLRRRGLATVVALVGACLLPAVPSAADDVASGTFASVTPMAVPDAAVEVTGSPIAVPDDASAAPSQVVVSSQGTVRHLTLRLTGVSHVRPADLDLLLVGPQGQQAVVSSDVGGCSLHSEPMLIDDALQPVLQGSCFAEHRRPTDFEPGDPFPGAPNDARPATFSVFDGSDPNGTWTLYAVDDTPEWSGAIDSWSLHIETTAGVVTQNMVVRGLTRGVQDVDLTLVGVSHDRLADLDIRLRAPNGTWSVPLSDVGSGVAAAGVTLRIDDDAATPLTAEMTSISSGRYRSADIDGYDDPPDPDGANGYASGLDLRYDTMADPNGIWTLEVADDSPGFSGTIAGWRLELVTSPVPERPTVDSTGSVSTSLFVNVSGHATAGTWVAVAPMDAPGPTNVVPVQSDGSWGTWVQFAGEGLQVVTAVTRDFYGNESPTAAVDVLVDTTPPTGGVVVPSRTSRRQLVVHPAATDRGSGVESLRLELDRGGFGPWQALGDVPVVLPDVEGPHRLRAEFRDRVGRTGVTQEYGVVLDRTPPSGRILSPARAATGVPPTTKVKLLASEHLLRGSVSTRTVLLYPADSSRAVAAAVAYDDVHRVVTLDPLRRLRPGTWYRAMMITSVRDLAGNRWDQDLTRTAHQPLAWRFRVR